MNVLTDTERALLAAIVEFPDEDDPRLRYSDWLQENGDEDRAEFVRLEIDIERMGLASAGPDRWDRRQALLTANRERWLRVPCPECDGSGKQHRSFTGDRYGPSCSKCGGTGDGGKLTWTINGRPQYPAVFRRGFVDEVQGCRLQDVFVWRQDRCEDECHYPALQPVRGWRLRPSCKTCEGSGAVTGWKPTDWATRVLTHFPTVTWVPLHEEFTLIPPELAKQLIEFGVKDPSWVGLAVVKLVRDYMKKNPRPPQE